MSGFPEKARSGGSETPTTASVVVVGAGVSGCACAATLAARGVTVLVVNSALDRVGLPGYGPIVDAPRGLGDIDRVLGALPHELREVWRAAAAVPSGGAAFAAVDRRKVSIETKRALELMPRLLFRQGLVCGLRTSEGAGRGKRRDDGTEQEARRQVVVETVFGEEFRAEAAVVAVGLSLGGHISAGEDSLRGGRYGETSAEGLRTALEDLGARYREVGVLVGPRFAPVGVAEAALEVLAEGVGLGERRKLHARVAPAEKLSDGRGRWSSDYPAAPHWMPDLELGEFYVREGKGGLLEPLVSPDGAAMHEVHVSVGENSGGVAGSHGPAPLMASRVAHEVRGLVIKNVGAGGRLGGDAGGGMPIWVTGRAGGSEGYLESLEAGARTGREVSEAVTGGCGVGQAGVRGRLQRDDAQ